MVSRAAASICFTTASASHCLLLLSPDLYCFNRLRDYHFDAHILRPPYLYGPMNFVPVYGYHSGKHAEFVHVPENIEQRNYFSFYNYIYYLDVQEQEK